MKTIPTLIALCMAAAFSAGCASSSQSPAGAPRETAAPEINRSTAILLARNDATARFRDLQVADITTRRLAGHWVVELRSPSGSGLRYAIATDGTIRERSVFQ